MIARDEAHNLPGCLGPVHNLVDEIIVVDTGSTDGTRKVAEEWGAKVVDFPWIDDFSAARNESLRHATGDYILWLDADDRLDSENLARLETLLDSLTDSPRAYVFRTVCAATAEVSMSTIITHPRLFRAHDQLRWNYRVHEQILSSMEQLNYEVVWSDVNVLHLGYASRELVHKKANRNLRLCRLDYAVSPNDPAVLFHLGKECARIGLNTEALGFLVKSLHLVTGRGTWVARLYGDIISTLILLGRKPEALSMVNQALVHFPTSHELLFRQAELLEGEGNRSAAEQSLRNLLQAPSQNRFGDALSVNELRRQAYRSVGAACLARGDFEQAEHFFQQWIAESPLDADAWCMLGYSYVRRGFAQKAEFVVRQLRKLPDGEAFACGIQSEVCKFQGNWQAARQHLERAIVIAPKLLMPHAMLVDLLMAVGADVEECRQAIIAFMRLAPGNTTGQRLLEQLNARQSQTLFSRVTVGSNASVAV